MNVSIERLQIEWGKLLLLALVIVGGFTLVLVSILAMGPDDERFAPVLALGSAQIAGAVGYLTGNGRLASKGEPNVPAIGAGPIRLAAAAAVSSELTALSDAELSYRHESYRQLPPTGPNLSALAAITLEQERRIAR